ncbi:MAG: GPW/gp25 family protein [Octadecabacter sp.]|nr:GPW/gp25 family protein [Octadecabacter sp.]
MNAEDAGFQGRGWAFPPRFDSNNGKANLVQNDLDIIESLRILMSTRPGERIMHPGYGCRLQDFVFEVINGTTRAAIETAIRQAILYYESRITLIEVSANVVDWLDGRISVQLEYTIDQTNARSNMVFPFYINEGTLVSDTPVLAV